MTCAPVLALLLAAAQPLDDTIKVSAKLSAESLEARRDYEIILDVSIKNGWGVSKSGPPAPILQIKAPPSVRLAGKVVKTYKDLADNAFLQKPFERLVKERPARVRFKLLRKPGADESFSLTLLAYVSPEADKANSRFIRRRLVLPVLPNASASVASPVPSDWGVENLVQLGQRPPRFRLPRDDGSMLSLDDYVGKKTVVVVTYRAFWCPVCSRQLGELQRLYDEFERRDTVVIAFSQEDVSLKSHLRILDSFDGRPRFEMAADLERKATPMYDRLTAYLIDDRGVVREIFPMIIYGRAPWRAILNEVDRLRAKP